MSDKEVIELVKELKSDAVRSQIYDAASILRSIENSSTEMSQFYNQIIME